MNDFHTVCGLLVFGGWSVETVADHLGVSSREYQLLNLPATHPFYVPPPADWKTRLRPLARTAHDWYRIQARGIEAALLADLEQET